MVIDLNTIDFGPEPGSNPYNQNSLPSALENIQEISRQIEGQQLALFLDYDGTLTPIVDRPNLAVLSDPIRITLGALAELGIVAVISGRDRVDVKRLIRLDSVYYAGSHGFDISGPGNFHWQHEGGASTVSDLGRAQEELDRLLKGIEGVLIEGKRFAVAVHYRLVPADKVSPVKQAVEAVAKDHVNLRMTGGKKIFELRPNIDWDKGKAVLWVLKALELGKKTVPIYIGDDETDEDAFQALKGKGIGILVSPETRPTEARYRLKDQDEVHRFLQALPLWIKRNDNDTLV